MKLTDEYVFFWKEHPMCNFTRCKIMLDDPYFVAPDEDPLEFTSSEQLFMWFKAKYFKDEETAEKIYKSSSPEEARQLGRLVKHYDDGKWDGVRVYYMRKAVTCKFQQNPDLQEKLLDEKYAGKMFIEAAYYDRIWGIGFNENEAISNERRWGRNELGKILTAVRNALKLMKESGKFPKA